MKENNENNINKEKKEKDDKITHILCEKCGKEINSQTHYCVFCGAIQKQGRKLVKWYIAIRILIVLVPFIMIFVLIGLYIEEIVKIIGGIILFLLGIFIISLFG